jgi:hypothetical protein
MSRKDPLANYNKVKKYQETKRRVRRKVGSDTLGYYSSLNRKYKGPRLAAGDQQYIQCGKMVSHIEQALDGVYYGLKDPKQALEAAAAKSARLLDDKF